LEQKKKSLKKIGIDLKDNQRVSEHDERSQDSENLERMKNELVLDEEKFEKIQLKEKAEKATNRLYQ